MAMRATAPLPCMPGDVGQQGQDGDGVVVGQAPGHLDQPVHELHLGPGHADLPPGRPRRRAGVVSGTRAAAGARAGAATAAVVQVVERQHARCQPLGQGVPQRDPAGVQRQGGQGHGGVGAPAGPGRPSSSRPQAAAPSSTVTSSVPVGHRSAATSSSRRSAGHTPGPPTRLGDRPRTAVQHRPGGGRGGPGATANSSAGARLRAGHACPSARSGLSRDATGPRPPPAGPAP